MIGAALTNWHVAPDTIVVEGVTYKKDRPASFLPDGGVLLSQLRNDEFVVAPGIIYREVKP